MKSAQCSFALSCLAATLLTACGGGSDSDSGAPTNTGAIISNETTQGYAADAASMPVTAASGLDTATTTLEAALPSGTVTPAAYEQTLAVTAAAGMPSFTVPCANGGSVVWSVSGGTLAQQLNGELDAGETYEITFTSCSGASGGLVLDGRTTLVVSARSATATDVTLTATALQLSSVQGRFTLDGNARLQRSVAVTSSGGTDTTTQIDSSGLALVSSIAGRQASYALNARAYEVVTTLDAGGALVARSHEGAADLAASTARRPAATLQATTLGALTLGIDGAAVQGQFTVIAGRDKITGVYGSGSITLTLDAGNDGIVDRTFTVPLGTFHSSAG